MKDSRLQEDSRPNWLCIAYAFPPINRSGTHRTLAFVKHLDRLGWDATVLTVQPKSEPVDESLLDELPVSTSVYRVPWVDVIERVKRVARRFRGLGRGESVLLPPGASTSRSCASTADASSPGLLASLKEWFSRLLITPDSRSGWVVPALRVGWSAIRRRRPEVIYSTSPYASAHLIALVLSKIARIPWVADFRDPWCGNPFRDRRFASLERLNSMFEWLVLRGATHIVCNTPTMADELCKRRSFVRHKCSTILNGFDRERFNDVIPKRIAPDDEFVLTHCGQFYGPRSPKVWFEALRLIQDRSLDNARHVRLVLVGSEVYGGVPLAQLALDAGVEDRVTVLGSRSHAETLALMAGSDALALAGSQGPGADLQIPNKLYEYIALRKPIVATCGSTGPIAKVLEEARAQAVVCDPGDAIALASAMGRLAERGCVDLSNPWCGLDRFDRAHRAAELAELFECVSRRRPISRPTVLRSGSLPVQGVCPTSSIPAEQVSETDAAPWSARASRRSE